MVTLVGGLSSGYAAPYYSGPATTDEGLVPGLFQVGIAGHVFMLNTDPNAIEDYGNNFKEESLPLLRQQADQGRTAGEQSLSPQLVWRRSADTWHGGGGQSVYDREISDPARFSTSKGIDPWTRYQLSLLNDTSLLRASAELNLPAVAANGRFYINDDDEILYTENLTSFTAVTGTPTGSTATVLVSGGGLVYAAYGAEGIFEIDDGTASEYLGDAVSNLGFAKGRLLASKDNILYNPVGGVLGSAIHTHPDPGWVWTAFADGDDCLYAAGVVGDRSHVYRTAVQSDGTALDVPVIAATLPTGELVRSLLGYLGFVIIGTDKGVRFAVASESGDLTLGALVPTPGPVLCLDAADRFVWFGWSNYDETSTGLGRFDLQTINDGQAPAFASDLMATAQGAVQATGVVSGRRLFTVAGVGVFVEDTGPVVSGELCTGQVTYGLSDAKVLVGVDLKHTPLPSGAAISVSLGVERGEHVDLGESTVQGSVSPFDQISARTQRAEEAELCFTLTADGTSPTLTRWTLKSYPAPAGTSTHVLPLMLAEMVTTMRGTEEPMNPLSEYLFLRRIHDDRELVSVKVGATSFEGVLEDYTWVPNALTFDGGFWNGTFIAKVRRIRG